MDALQFISPHIPGFLVGLFIAFLVWLILDYKAIKAELASLKAKAAPVAAAVEHDLHLAESVVRVPAKDAGAIIHQFLVDVKAEAARIEAARLAAAANPPAAPAPAIQA